MVAQWQGSKEMTAPPILEAFHRHKGLPSAVIRRRLGRPKKIQDKIRPVVPHSLMAGRFM